MDLEFAALACNRTSHCVAWLPATAVGPPCVAYGGQNVVAILDPTVRRSLWPEGPSATAYRCFGHADVFGKDPARRAHWDGELRVLGVSRRYAAPPRPHSKPLLTPLPNAWSDGAILLTAGSDGNVAAREQVRWGWRGRRGHTGF